MTRVGSFVFEIRAAFDTLDGYNGEVTLAGVRIGSGVGGHEILPGGGQLISPLAVTESPR